jgi:hypothetical protein
MLGFREWVVLDETRTEIYESILADIALHDAFKKTFDLYNEAVSGRRRRFAEDSSEENTDEIELDDPFAGGENAKPVRVAQPDPPRPSGPSDAEVAKRIQELAWAVRWGAMLDRLEAVQQIGEIYKNEWMPLMARRNEEIEREYKRASAATRSDEEARRLVGQKFGMSTYEVGKVLAGMHNEWSVIGEADDFELPDFDNDDGADPQGSSEVQDSSDISFEEYLKQIRAKAEPLLVKLGYLNDGDLDSGEPYERQRLLGSAIEGAKNEQGNEPPDNEVTKLLKSDPSARAASRRELQQLLHDKFIDTANSSYRSKSQKMGSLGKGSDGTRGGRRGSVYFQGAEDVINQGVMSVMRSLTHRPVKQDMTAIEWKKELKVLNGTAVPDEVLGSIGTRVSKGAGRDEGRARKRASGLTGNSEDSPTFLSGGAMKDDGTQGSIDPKDYRSQDSLGASERGETRDALISAFRDAMRELKEMDPLWAMLVCLKMNLGCNSDGSMPPHKAEDLLKMAMPDSQGNQSPEGFFSRIGLSGTAAGQADDQLTRKIQLGDYWDSLKDLKGKRGRRPSPKMADGSPMRERPTDNLALAKEWDKFKMTVKDSTQEAFKWLSKRMYELVAEYSPEFSRPAGHVSPSSWDLARFLRTQFRSPAANVTEKRPAKGEQEIKLEFKEKQRVRSLSGEMEDADVTTKAWDILVKDNSISIFQSYPEGFEDNEFEFEIPAPTTCPACGGSDDNCQTCGGDGMALDPAAIRKLEWDLRNLLIRSQRKVSRG